MTVCFSCKATIPDIQGPTHKYMLSSPGCWQLYGEILAKEYNQFYDSVTHRLTVDTYAVTHPGNRNDRRAVRSVNIHLIALYGNLEKGFNEKKLQQIIDIAAEDRKLDKKYKWIKPPKFDNTLHVTDVLTAKNQKKHKEIVSKWAKSVWEIWKEENLDKIKALSDEVLQKME